MPAVALTDGDRSDFKKLRIVSWRSFQTQQPMLYRTGFQTIVKLFCHFLPFRLLEFIFY
jgi:hypothetical protein